MEQGSKKGKVAATAKAKDALSGYFVRPKIAELWPLVGADRGSRLDLRLLGRHVLPASDLINSPEMA